mmetsp:Transcript_50517/g.152179  ORF Transcript_50517/g.152179 Transcript_50517/m.152179 type:complete len:216 (-) Transcript_50517:67-714(-)
MRASYSVMNDPRLARLSTNRSRPSNDTNGSAKVHSSSYARESTAPDKKYDRSLSRRMRVSASSRDRGGRVRSTSEADSPSSAPSFLSPPPPPKTFPNASTANHDARVTGFMSSFTTDDDDESPPPPPPPASSLEEAPARAQGADRQSRRAVLPDERPGGGENAAPGGDWTDSRTAATRRKAGPEGTTKARRLLIAAVSLRYWLFRPARCAAREMA